jgi:hypothetical protein
VKGVERKPGEPITSEQLQAIVERGRQIPKAPHATRVRLLARARSSVAGVDRAPVPVVLPAAAWRGHRVRFALAASLAIALASAGAAAAFHAWSSRATEAVAAEEVADPPASPAPPIQLPALAPAPAASPPSPHAARARAITPQESYVAELALLQRAHADYAHHRYARALGVVAEHARRFPNGRLAEEREALRVRSLAGAGRTQEARLAYASFARRFPRSVLLSRLQQTDPAAEE